MQLCSKLTGLHELSIRPESERAIERSRSRNKLLTCERVQNLVDKNSAILSLSPLAGLDVYEGVPPGAGICTSIARVSGKLCMIIANNPGIKGGTYFPLTVKKHLRAQEIALVNRLPCIYLVDSGGAFLPLQDQVFPDKEHFGRIFFNQAQMSSMAIPQISVVMGSCTAGGAYVPAMSDESVMVRGNATIFLGGPPLVKAATGEEVNAEDLGGADVHCKISGVADHIAYNDVQALEIARRIIKTCSSNCSSEGDLHLSPEQSAEQPLYDPAEIPGIIGTRLQRTYPMLEVIARLVDGSRFEQFKSEYGKTLICGFAHIHGFRIGIIANDGILFSESALKGTHFIQLCEQRKVPILFLHNISGFMVGKKYEHQGIAKHGAKLVTAVATTSVPKFSLIVGGSFGAGNYGMCGRAYEPRFLFSWPNSRISVMGGRQAAEVLSQVKSNPNSKNGSDSANKEIETLKNQIFKKYEREGDAFYATARLWDDGIITPTTTRRTLALAFATTYFDKKESRNFGLFRM